MPGTTLSPASQPLQQMGNPWEVPENLPGVSSVPGLIGSSFRREEEKNTHTQLSTVNAALGNCKQQAPSTSGW